MRYFRNKKNMWIFCSIVLVNISCLSGCMSVTKGEQEKNSSWESQIEALKNDAPGKEGGRIEGQASEEITFQAEVKIPSDMQEYKVTKLRMKRHRYDRERVKKAWEEYCKGQKVIKEHNRSDTDEYLENGEEEQSYEMEFADGTSVMIRDSRILVSNGEKTDKRNALISLSEYGNSFGLEYASQRDLDFISVKEADKIIRDLYKKCGIDNILEYKEYYTAGIEELEKAKEALGEEYEKWTAPELKNPEVTKEDEMYWFAYYQGYEEIPFVTYSMKEEETKSGITSGVEHNLHVCYGRDGIVNFDGVPSYKVEQCLEKEDILSLGEISDLFVQEKNKDILTVDLRVNGIELAYLPVLVDGSNFIYETVPLWCVLYERYDETFKHDVEEYVIYDARDGRRL